MDAATAAPNSFLSSHKVLTIDCDWVDFGSSSYWALCVNYLQRSSSVVQTPSNDLNVAELITKKFLLLPSLRNSLGPTFLLDPLTTLLALP